MLSFAELTSLAHAAERQCAGAQVADLSAGPLDSLVVHLRTTTDERPPRLWLVLRRDLARLMVTSLPGHVICLPEPSTVAKLFARELGGLTLRSIEVATDDRWLRIDFSGPEPRSLIAELFGQPGTAYVVDQRGTVLATSRAKARIAIGAPYQRPRPPLAAALTAPGATLAAASDEELGRAAQLDHVQRLVRSEQQRLRDRRDHDRRAVLALEADLAATTQADTLRGRADILMANLTRLERGASAAILTDFDGHPVTITLDPSVPPHHTAEKLYHRARKLDRAAPIIAARLTQLREQVTAAERRLAEIDAMLVSDPAQALAQLGGKGAQAKRAREPRTKVASAAARPREYHSAEGLRIAVGRDDRENDRLTASAHGNDLWLHVQAAAGSHVLVRVPKGRSAALETIRDASLLAVHFSKLRDAERADVMYTPCKFVRRTKGRPGQVTVARHKTFSCTRDEARLRQLFSQMEADP